MTPYELGEQAYHNGLSCAPVLDPALVAMLDPQIGNNVKLYKQWIRGWDIANLGKSCPHVPERSSAWYVQDTLCIGCCDCGEVLAGGA